MIRVAVDRPLCAHYVRIHGGYEPAETLGGTRINDCGAVDLPGEHRFSSQNLAGRFAFARPDCGGLIVRLTLNAGLAASQVDDCDSMSERRITSKSSAAAGLWIIGVTTHTNNLQLRI